MTDSPQPHTAATDAEVPEWLVLSCPHCEHPLKIRNSEAGGQFLCPSCQEEVSAPAPEGAAGPPQRAAADEPWPDQPGGLAVDRLGSAQFRSIDDPALAIPEEGIRVRKRKRRSHPPRPGIDTPEWEVDLPTEARGGPGSSGEREEGPVGEHRRRSRHRGLPAFVERSWGFMARVGSLSLISLGLFVLVGAAAAGWYLAKSRPPVVAQVIVKEQFPERYFPTQDEGVAAATLVQQFLAAETLEGKLPLVRFPEKVKPLMELWYKGRPDRAIRASRDELAETLTKFVHIDGTKFIVVTMLTEPDAEYKMYAVESSPADGLKVDWETAVGWQAMTVEEFVKGKPTTPQPFRVQAAPGDYYNGYYGDESRWCAVNLTYPGNADFNLYGYVERNTPAGDRLMRLIGYHETKEASGETKWELVQPTSVPLILAIAYLREGSDPKQVTIHEVLHEQWFLRDGPAVGNARKSAANQ